MLNATSTLYRYLSCNVLVTRTNPVTGLTRLRQGLPASGGWDSHAAIAPLVSCMAMTDEACETRWTYGEFFLALADT